MKKSEAVRFPDVQSVWQALEVFATANQLDPADLIEIFVLGKIEATVRMPRFKDLGPVPVVWGHGAGGGERPSERPMSEQVLWLIPRRGWVDPVKEREAADIGFRASVNPSAARDCDDARANASVRLAVPVGVCLGSGGGASRSPMAGQTLTIRKLGDAGSGPPLRTKSHASATADRESNPSMCQSRSPLARLVASLLFAWRRAFESVGRVFRAWEGRQK